MFTSHPACDGTAMPPLNAPGRTPLIPQVEIGPAQLQHPVIGPGGQAQLAYGCSHQILNGSVKKVKDKILRNINNN